MPSVVPDHMRAPDTPDEVEIRLEPRAPGLDPTLGIAVDIDRSGGEPAHRLVTVGDSLTHGFQSGAIFRTEVSYPAIVAHELGCLEEFRFPRYGGFGGLPLNIEYVIRALEEHHGSMISWWELAPALFRLRSIMDRVEDHWERGAGSIMPNLAGINHNLGIYGWDLRDALSKTTRHCTEAIGRPTDALLKQVVDNANERAALRVLVSATEDGQPLSPLEAALKLGRDGTPPDGGPGIETLVVMLGANNALQTVTKLEVVWSGEHFKELDGKSCYTVWRPSHFAEEFAEIVALLSDVRARHVILATVPHVTIAPIARGVEDKSRKSSRYYPHYTRPWITDEAFDPGRDPSITEQQARAIDCAIDQYNAEIVAAVRTARQAGKDWYLLDLAGLLDRLAFRRYIDDEDARPDWWDPYVLPPELDRQVPKLDSRFFRSGPEGRTEGGLFSLDGVHPTTITYGLIAQEIIAILSRAGVRFRHPGGLDRDAPIRVDFERLLRLDTLIADPPTSLSPGLELVGWVDEQLDAFRRLFWHGGPR